VPVVTHTTNTLIPKKKSKLGTQTPTLSRSRPTTGAAKSDKKRISPVLLLTQRLLRRLIQRRCYCMCSKASGLAGCSLKGLRFDVGFLPVDVPPCVRVLEQRHFSEDPQDANGKETRFVRQT